MTCSASSNRNICGIYDVWFKIITFREKKPRILNYKQYVCFIFKKNTYFYILFDNTTHIRKSKNQTIQNLFYV